MSWMAFKGYNNNKAVNVSTFDQTELAAFGMHWYSTAAEAQAHPNSVNLLSKTAVNAAISDANNARDYASAPANAARAVSGATGITSVTDFLKGIASANLWIRVAEVSLGGVLIIVGLAKLTGASGKIAKTAVRTAPFL